VGRTHVRFRKVFVAVQVGLSAVLLLGAGLFIRSSDQPSTRAARHAPENVITFLAGPAMPYDDARKIQAYSRID
jgi:hypothetical protein